MGLFARYRRPWSAIALGLLATPLLFQAVETPAAVSEEEARVLSPWPPWPGSLRGWLALPRDLDRFLGDHFGLREQLVRAHGVIRYAVLLPSDLRVIIGRDRWLFLAGDGTIEQATGQWLREARIAEFADRAARFQARLAVRNVRLLVAIPPNGPTINRARLPAWAAAKPAKTEYDLMLAALAARGVRAVDLRPPLLAVNALRPVYRRTDTHWNRLGALVAYNASVEALGEPGWVIDPDRVFRGFEPAPGGDLARLLAIDADVTDEDAIIDLSPYRPLPTVRSPIDTHFESGGDLVEVDRGGATVVVIGDSFTQGLWQDYFSLHARRYVWIHHEQCGFVVPLVEAYDPQIVILAPTELEMFCSAQ
jgi:alginate O-acetyltransferase complex protein AlgJ